MPSLRHKKIIKLAAGYRGRAKSCYKTAVQAVHRGWQYAYRDRKQKKRDIRKLWIQRVNAGVRLHGGRYNWLIGAMKQSNVELDRKVLSELAMNEPLSFQAVVETVHTVVPRQPIKVGLAVTL